MTSVMQRVPPSLRSPLPSALVTLDDSVLFQVSLAAQAKGPKLHVRQERVQVTRIDDLPEEVMVTLIHQHFGPRDSCSLAQVSSKYRHLAVSLAGEMDRDGHRDAVAQLNELLVRVFSLMMYSGRHCTDGYSARSML